MQSATLNKEFFARERMLFQLLAERDQMIEALLTQCQTLQLLADQLDSNGQSDPIKR